MVARAVAHIPLLGDAKQSTIWLGALLAMFVLYLAMNNRLLAYWSLLSGGTGQAASASATGGSTATTPSTAPPGSTSGGSTGQPRLFIPSNPNVPPS